MPHKTWPPDTVLVRQSTFPETDDKPNTDLTAPVTLFQLEEKQPHTNSDLPDHVQLRCSFAVHCAWVSRKSRGERWRLKSSTRRRQSKWRRTLGICHEGNKGTFGVPSNTRKTQNPRGGSRFSGFEHTLPCHQRHGNDFVLRVTIISPYCIPPTQSHRTTKKNQAEAIGRDHNGTGPSH